MTRIPTGVALALLAVAMLCRATPAQAADAQDAAARQARNHAAACSSCHGPEGRAPAGSPIPALAGRPASRLVEQMQAFKAGTRKATVMQQIALGYSDAQIRAIAAWFAAVR